MVVSCWFLEPSLDRLKHCVVNIKRFVDVVACQVFEYADRMVGIRIEPPIVISS